MKHLTVVLLVVMVAGCSGKKGPSRFLDPEEIFPEDPGDTTTYNYPKTKTGKGLKKSSPKTILGKAIRQSEYDMFYVLEQAARATRKPDNILKYLEQGVVLSNQVCDRWFDELEYAQANVEFWKNNVAISGGLATTVMGALKSATREIAVVSALFSSVVAGFDNYSGSFLFSPDIEKIRKKIGDARREKAVLLREVAATGESYENIKDELQLYHELCSGSEIRRLLNASLDLTRFTFSEDNFKKKLRNAELELSIKQLNQAAFDLDFIGPLEKMPIRYLAVNLSDDDKGTLSVDSLLTPDDKYWVNVVGSIIKDVHYDPSKRRNVFLNLEKIAGIEGYGKLLNDVKSDIRQIKNLEGQAPARDDEINALKQSFKKRILGDRIYPDKSMLLTRPKAVIDTTN